jgi:hypothetical protein
MADFFGWTLLLGSIAAWFTHLFTCFSEGAWGFLVAGAIFFPIGVLHGAWLWFQ